MDPVLWHTASGTGPPLVLCHGGPGMWDYLEPLARMLDDRVTVIRYDQRGCGRSGGSGPFSVAQSVADLDALRARLGYDAWSVSGHSWGAALALECAMAHPDRSSSLLYVSGVGIGKAWNAAYHAEADRRRTPEQNARLAELAAIASRDVADEREYRRLAWLPDNATELADAPFRINYEANRTISNEMKTWDEADKAAQAAQLTVPTLIVHGLDDTRPHWAIDSLASALSNVTVVKIPGAGHFPWMDQPEATAAALRACL
jgi:proline iminopeptidase